MTLRGGHGAQASERRVAGRELLETGLTANSPEKPKAMIFAYRRVVGGPASR